MDKAAIGWSIGIVAVGVLFAVYGQGIQEANNASPNIPPSNSMMDSSNTMTEQREDTTTTVNPDKDMMMEPSKLVQVVQGEIVIDCIEATSMNKDELVAAIERDVLLNKDNEKLQMLLSGEVLSVSEIADEIMMNCKDIMTMMKSNDDGMMMDRSTMQDEATMSKPQTVTVDIPAGTSVPGCEATNECYIEPVVTINVGDTVIWNNLDTAAHTVTSGGVANGPDGKFDSSLLPSDSAFSHTFDEKGSFDYYCIVHPWMTGTVNVN